MKKIFLRADSSHEIGSGHVMRMIALGEILENDFEVTLVTSHPEEALFRVLVIQNEEEFYEVLDREAIAVLDGYHFHEEVQKKVKEKVSKLVCIDDYQHHRYFADLVINHAPGVKEDQISALPNTRYLLGPKYALLRKSFLESQILKNSKNFSNVLICFGGSDVHDLSFKYTQALIDQSLIKSVSVIVGKQYHGKCTSIQDEKVEVFSDLSDLQMRDLMRRNDFAIVSASTILFECLSQGLPCISGFYVDNQKSIYNGFLNQNAILGLGELKDTSSQDILEAISELIEHSNSGNIQTIFDDQIKQRLISEFLAL